MADESLKKPVTVQATSIDATFIPQGFALPYKEYVRNQGSDLGKVAVKANNAGQGAFDAQVKNDEQDTVLANHENRITTAEEKLVNHEIRISAAEETLVDHEVRITNAEAALVNHEGRITTLEGDVEYLIDEVSAQGERLDTVETDIDTLETNSISKAVSTSQSVQATGGSFLVGPVATPTTDPLQVSTSANAGVSYKVAGIQVVGAQQTGWTPATGTANKGEFNADLAFAVGTTYSQAEVQALAVALKEARQRILALEQVNRSHGLTN